MILFRCDASRTIGTGHVMRCLSLADRYRRLGFESIFALKAFPGQAQETVKDAGFRTAEIPENVEWDQEPAWLKENLEALSSVKLVIVDHYNLDAKWESAFIGKFRVAVIDDLSNRDHAAHALIDYNYRRDQGAAYSSRVAPFTKLYLGPTFCLLRSSLVDAAKKFPATRKSDFNRCLVFFGGSDPSGETLKFLAATEAIKMGRLAFNVLVSRNHSDLDSIRSWRAGSNVRIHIDPKDLGELFMNSDLFFGSGGTITWERMLFGLPAWVVSVAENQEKIASELAQDGYQFYLGKAENQNYSEIISKIEVSSTESSILHDLSASCRDLVHPIEDKTLLEIYGGF